MRRLHVHLAVADLPANLDFYTRLLGAPPALTRPDYARWVVDDPPLKLSVSRRNGPPGAGPEAFGLDHLGIAADEADLARLRERAEAATEGRLLDEGEVECCYARSEKHWATDPQGVPWEHFFTKGPADTLGSGEGVCCTGGASPCC